jgi:hypothetical protein
VSIVFGYLHGLIKLYALFTLKEVRALLHTFSVCVTMNSDSITDLLGKSRGRR